MPNKLKSIERVFDISPREMKRFISDFHSEMKRGLGGRKSSLKMLRAFAKKPSGAEKGSFLAIDLGGTNLRVSMLRLAGKRKVLSHVSEKFVLRNKHIKTTGEALFDFIALCMKNFMRKHKIDIKKPHNAGFTFSFPIKKTGIKKGVLLRWTKGFSAKDVEGKDVVELLNSSFAKKRLYNTKVVAIINDTVSTLLTKSYEDPRCDVGVILGTGTNACYYDARGRCINTEWGNFSKLSLTAYDKALDSSSENPGEQLLEKMVSGMYLGRLTGIVSADLNASKKVENFKTESLSALKKNTPLRKIYSIISTRAARLAALAIASVVTAIDPRLSREHTIAIDGSLYEKHPRFSKKVKSTIKDIFGKKAKKINLKLTKDASSKGAAIAAGAL